jgi:hypothetical protein
MKMNAIIRGPAPSNLDHPLGLGESSILRGVRRELMKDERERQDHLRRKLNDIALDANTIAEGREPGPDNVVQWCSTPIRLD